MSQTHIDDPGAQPEAGHQARPHGGRHPSPKEYIRIAIILAIITAAEVAIYYVEGAKEFLIPLLFLFALIKFSLVVMWFMHLRFDSRTYARFFVMGLAGAITLYLVVLLTFQVFAG
ncbi:MAG TPA: cytochrome C oxidase subunit IV family protein [Actinomycetota bacterium]|jgi:cytochrome c oxidase subunit 4|nr:cytochrome C oxidase subunit IV family protein [Actinomycetota bacterium]